VTALSIPQVSSQIARMITNQMQEKSIGSVNRSQSTDDPNHWCFLSTLDERKDSKQRLSVFIRAIREEEKKISVTDQS
jgi:hypothetical protein